MAKGASAAARVHVEDDLDSADQSVSVWQRGQALDTWARMKGGDLSEVSKAEIDADFHAVLEQLKPRPA
jgi:hypothetical protein